MLEPQWRSAVADEKYREHAELELARIREASRAAGPNPQLAAFLSLLVPGLGQFYLRQFRWAAAFFIPSLALIWAIFPWVIGMKVSAVFAFITAHRRRGERSLL